MVAGVGIGRDVDVCERYEAESVDLAGCRVRKPAVAWVLGNRSRATAQRLWQQLPANWQGPRCWYFTFDNLRLALSQANVRSII